MSATALRSDSSAPLLDQDIDARVPASPATLQHISIVVPCYNEAPVLPEFDERLTRVMGALPFSWDVIYVNDGSADGTLDLLLDLQRRHPNTAVLNLSRNFGKEAAMTAGLDYAQGDAVIVIDADLQDPPEVIPDLVLAWQRGFDVAYAQRRAREGETWTKRATAKLFYRAMARLGRTPVPVDTGDFRLMSRRAVESLRKLREQHRFMKGLFAWVGFPQVAVPYNRAPRYAGETKWNYWKLWNFAVEGITSFSLVPLKFSTYFGLLIAFGAALYGLFLIILTLVFVHPVPGYPSLMVAVLFMGGVQLITLGVLGEYVGRIFNEVKARPIYLIERFLPAETNPKPK